MSENRKRTEQEMRKNCAARIIPGASCQYPDCDCFRAADYYEDKARLIADAVDDEITGTGP